MDSLKLDTSCTALILVDLQRGIVVAVGQAAIYDGAKEVRYFEKILT
jgi:hypothetical protein